LDDVGFVRVGLERWIDTREIHPDRFGEGFVWDMSTFEGWTEEQQYPGPEGARRFLDLWTTTWDEYDLQIEDIRAGAAGKVVADMIQRAVSPAGLEVEMTFAMVWTVRDSRLAWMSMYRDRGEAAAAAAVPDAP
jgi:ketosteroid isomerase-like protein